MPGVDFVSIMSVIPLALLGLIPSGMPAVHTRAERSAMKTPYGLLCLYPIHLLHLLLCLLSSPSPSLFSHIHEKNVLYAHAGSKDWGRNAQ